MTHTEKHLPEHILLEKWADSGFAWQGHLHAKDFDRLVKNVDLTCQDGDNTLQVAVNLAKENGILWLHYQVAGRLLTPCQRCLSPMPIDVSGEYRLAILASESDIDKIQGAEFVLVDEICPAERKTLPLKDLLEDELLLALPLAPRHEACEMLLDSVGDIVEEESENPFAVLASLKGKLS